MNYKRFIAIVVSIILIFCGTIIIIYIAKDNSYAEYEIKIFNNTTNNYSIELPILYDINNNPYSEIITSMTTKKGNANYSLIYAEHTKQQAIYGNGDAILYVKINRYVPYLHFLNTTSNNVSHSSDEYFINIIKKNSTHENITIMLTLYVWHDKENQGEHHATEYPILLSQSINDVKIKFGRYKP